MVSLVNPHSNATSRRWHLWEIDLRFASGLPAGWIRDLGKAAVHAPRDVVALGALQREK